MTFTGYIYKLTGACGKVYIGSTVDFNNRMGGHNFNGNVCRSNLLVKPIVDEIIDTREYILTKTLRLVEQFYLDNINNINDKRAYGIDKIRQQKRKKEWDKKYKEKYPEKLRKSNNERGKRYRERNPEKHRKKSNEAAKRYREGRGSEKVKCQCGCMVSRKNITSHKKTKKHIQLIQNQT